MKQALPPQRVLASIGCGWQVCELADGSIQIKLREAELYLGLVDFQAFCALVNQSCVCRPADTVLLAQAGEQRTIVYHAAQRRVMVQFDRVVLCLAPRDLPLLVVLCQHASETLANLEVQRRSRS